MLFYKEKIDISFIKFIVKLWMKKKCLIKEIKYIILNCVCENFCDSIWLQLWFRFRIRYGKKLRFLLRFRFRDTAFTLWVFAPAGCFSPLSSWCCGGGRGVAGCDILFWNRKTGEATLLTILYTYSSVHDPWHFGAYPDPLTRTSD